MENIKMYKNMTSAEQLDWTKQFGDWIKNDWKSVNDNFQSWGKEQRQSMEKGMMLIGSFGYAVSFVSEALRFGDYHCRIKQMSRIIEQIKTDILTGLPTGNIKGETVMYISNLNKVRKRGHPSKAEYEAEQREQDTRNMDNERAKLIAGLLGMKILTDETEREKNNDELREERLRKEEEDRKLHPSLFDMGSEDQSENKKNDDTIKTHQTDEEETIDETKTCSNSQHIDTESVSARTPHLDEIKLLLSKELQQRVESVRDLRSEASDAATRVKILAENGAKREEIQQMAELSNAKTQEYQQIYMDVDKELATLYARLKDDKAFLKEHHQEYNVKTVLETTKVYYQKADDVLKASINKMINDNNPAVVKARIKEMAIKKEAAAIIKYLRRTDKPNTEKRICGMEEKYQRLQKLIGSEEAKPYFALIELAKKNKKIKN